MASLDVRMSINEQWLVDSSFRPLGNQKCSQSPSQIYCFSDTPQVPPTYRWDTALRAGNKCNVLLLEAEH